MGLYGEEGERSQEICSTKSGKDNKKSFDLAQKPESRKRIECTIHEILKETRLSGDDAENLSPEQASHFLAEHQTSCPRD